MSELTVTTDVAIRVFETTPAVVSFNYQEISDHLAGVLEKYKGLVFSDKDVAECKKTIAELRKGQKSLDEFRKATKKQLTESVTAFEAQCKLLYGKFDVVIAPLTMQSAQFELDRQNLKRVEIQSFIDVLIADHMLADKFAEQLVIYDEYLAKGKTIKAIKAELLALANTLSVQEEKEAQDIDLIKTKVQLANAEYQLAPRNLTADQYLRLLGYKSVTEIDLLITTDAQTAKDVFDALKADKAAEVPKVEAITPEPVEIPSVGNATLSVSDEPRKVVAIYEVSGTAEQLEALEEYLDDNCLVWVDRTDEEEDDSDGFMN